jgi:acyl-CoA reductase-like NAD-dependent aldehyde dehydrogenase
VHERIYDDFVEAFVAAVRGFKVGDPRDEATYIGPLTRKAQLAVLKRQVADARKNGARLVAGGKPLARKGYFAPTGVDSTPTTGWSSCAKKVSAR